MLFNDEIRDIVYLYTKNKSNMILSLGLITPVGTQKMCFGADGKILDTNQLSYEIGSITKSFVASLVTMLVNQKRISLLDEVCNGITLEQLLTHRSGIKEYPVTQRGWENPFSDILPKDVSAYLVKAKVSDDPQWEYSNLGYALIGMYLGERLNQPFAEILEEYSQNTLQLERTHIGCEGADLWGNDGSHVFKWHWNRESAFLPAGCLVSTLDDMLAYLQLHMKKDEYRLCHHTHLETSMPFDMGLAFMKQKETGITFCMGLTSGFSSFIGFDKTRRFGVVVLSNYCGSGYGKPDTPNGIGFAILKEIGKEC